MTEQLKAEAYVRSQRPALLELKFGCEVIFNKIKRDVYATRGNKKEVYIQRVMDFTWVPIEKIEIIGHQPQLQDWMAVLGHWYWVDGSGCVWKTQGVGSNTLRLNWKFNMETGQPNSPEDYKTFNDIVSV